MSGSVTIESRDSVSTVIVLNSSFRLNPEGTSSTSDVSQTKVERNPISDLFPLLLAVVDGKSFAQCESSRY